MMNRTTAVRDKCRPPAACSFRPSVIPQIAPGVLRNHGAVRRAFENDYPLPRFVIIRNFLSKDLLNTITRQCQQAQYSTYCNYSTPAAPDVVRSDFCEPNERNVYVSIHERPLEPLPALVHLSELFKKREALQFLSSLTGVRLTTVLEPDVLISWQPGAFLEPHTDHGPDKPGKLVLSLSLTTRWHSSYGGATVFAWSGLSRAVRLQPRLNTAVLFAPWSGSLHWVEQISSHAPPRHRFTWTVFFA